MKKTLILILAFMLSFSVCYASDNYKEYIGDGKMTLYGSCEDAVLGDVVTLTVVSGDFDWSNKVSWETINSNESVIKYYDEAVADANGGYKFDYYLSDQGEYTLYVGSEKLSKIRKEEIVFINEEKSKTAISDLNSATDADTIEQIFKDGKYSFGVYSDIYDSADLENTANILFSYYSAGGEKTIGFDDTKALLYKALMVDMLSKGNIETISDYWGNTGIENEPIGKYYDDNNASKIAQELSKENISSIADYEDAMFYAIAGSVIETNDNIGNIKNILLDYCDKIEIDKSDVTSELASYLAGKSLYSKSAIQNAVSDYKRYNDNSDGGNRGGSGSSKGASAKLSGYTYPETTFPDKNIEAEENFSDLQLVPWAKEAINSLYSRGVISGRSEGIFAPTEPVLREECAKLITEAFKFYVIGDKLTFEDVSDESWYSKYVSRAYHAGIIKGFSNTQFGAGYSVTRQDLAVMVYNALKQADIVLTNQNNTVSINDIDMVAPYAIEAVNELCKAGIISGDENGYFNPKNSANRAETAKIIYYAMNLSN